MPPRYAYWTILVGEQPTAFRAGDREDLQPTFKRLKERHASARMVWFQNGKIWDSRLDAQEAMRARGEMGRRRDARQGGGFRDRNRGDRPAPPVERRDPAGKLEWKPKGEATKPRPEWRPKSVAKPSRPRRPRATPKPGDRRDKTWRPGGEHRDPRQKYKDAKKAKWTRFKHTIRKRWESKQPGKKKSGE